jgi:hypothetical protein
MEIEFRATTDPPGIDIVDPIDQRHLRIDTPDEDELQAASTESFIFPVESAVSFEAKKLRFDQRDGLSVHDQDANPVLTTDSSNNVEIEGGSTYEVGLSSSIRLYLRIRGPCVIKRGLDNIQIQFDRTRQIEIGGRSLHEQPATTIQTPADPKSLAKAVSLFSSALKTLSPERSFATLRGHPPLLEQGDKFEAASTLSRMDSGIRIFVPETLQSVATVTSLSFYLGADVGFDDRRPRVVTEHGFEYSLGNRHAFEEDVARLLKQQFLMDCVVRTAGLYPVNLYERNRVAEHFPYDLESTYNADIGTRFERYTAVNYDTIESYLPWWPLTAHVPDDPKVCSSLPFIADQLGVARSAEGNVFTRETSIESAPLDSKGTLDASQSAGTETHEMTFVEPSVTDESLEHAWFGNHIPQGASKPTLEAFTNQLEQRVSQTSIDITVVCNDPRMLGEQEFLDSAYKNRKELPYDVTTKFGLTTEKLASVLTEEGSDFLHYIGHATSDGLRCIDGKLDVTELDTVEVQTFLLNACQSHQQAMAFVEQGAYGGVGTLGEVVNDHAIEIGKMFAYLLNLGCPLRAAIDIVSENTTIGEQYIVVGDGSTDVVQSTGGSPFVCHVESTDNKNRFEVSFDFYPTKYLEFGTHSTAQLKSMDEFYVVPNKTESYQTSRQDLQEFLTWMEYPVKKDGVWNWNRSYDSDPVI